MASVTRTVIVDFSPQIRLVGAAVAVMNAGGPTTVIVTVRTMSAPPSTSTTTVTTTGPGVQAFQSAWNQMLLTTVLFAFGPVVGNATSIWSSAGQLSVSGVLSGSAIPISMAHFGTETSISVSSMSTGRPSPEIAI